MVSVPSIGVIGNLHSKSASFWDEISGWFLGAPFSSGPFVLLLICSQFWRVCSQFGLSVRNSGWGPFKRNAWGNPITFLVGRAGVRGPENCETNWRFLQMGALKWGLEVVVQNCTRLPTIALRAQILKKIKIAWNFQSRLKISISPEIFNPDLQNSPQKIRGLVGGLLEVFKHAWKFQDLEIFQDLGP